MPADLRTRVGHLDLPSPILTAAGCAGTGRELAQFTDVARIGAVITKSVTLEPRAGNPAPRMAETPSGLLSSVGLQGPGLDGDSVPAGEGTDGPEHAGGRGRVDDVGAGLLYDRRQHVHH